MRDEEYGAVNVIWPGSQLQPEHMADVILRFVEDVMRDPVWDDAWFAGVYFLHDVRVTAICNEWGFPLLAEGLAHPDAGWGFDLLACKEDMLLTGIRFDTLRPGKLNRRDNRFRTEFEAMCDRWFPNLSILNNNGEQMDALHLTPAITEPVSLEGLDPAHVAALWIRSDLRAGNYGDYQVPIRGILDRKDDTDPLIMELLQARMIQSERERDEIHCPLSLACEDKSEWYVPIRETPYHRTDYGRDCGLCARLHPGKDHTVTAAVALPEAVLPALKAERRWQSGTQTLRDEAEFFACQKTEV